MTKRRRAERGGRATVRKRGRAWMREIGKRGNAATRSLYQFITVGTSGYALVRRADNQVVAIWSARPPLLLVTRCLRCCASLRSRLARRQSEGQGGS